MALKKKSVMILQDLIKPMAREAMLKAFLREKSIRAKYGKEFVAKPRSSSEVSSGTSTPKSKANQSIEIKGRVAYSRIQGRDIYGNEKPTAVLYFECVNCKRKVAGSRFAAHIERCLSGRNSRKYEHLTIMPLILFLVES
jgi:SAGA-associated factor 11